MVVTCPVPVRLRYVDILFVLKPAAAEGRTILQRLGAVLSVRSIVERGGRPPLLPARPAASRVDSLLGKVPRFLESDAEQLRNARYFSQVIYRPDLLP